MGDFPSLSSLPITVWTGGMYGLGNERALHGGSAAPGTFPWGTANIAVYIPIFIPFRYPVKNLFVYNFATVNGNHDVGIFSDELTKLVSSGSVAQAGANGLQFMAVDLMLDPGQYYLAMSSNSTTATYAVFGTPTVTRQRYTGLLQQATAFPLPATATPVTLSAARFPVIGFTYQTGTPNF